MTTPDERPAAAADTDATPGARAGLKETYRRQMVDSIGGWQGALITAIPTAVFVVVNVAASLRVAVVAAIGSALALAGYRLLRRQSVQQAVSGLIGVVVAAVVAARTGEARGFFLLGIWTSFVYAVPFAISVLVRRPLIGLAWEFLDPTPACEHRPWHRHRPLLSAYTWATAAATLVFLSRGIVQWRLYDSEATGWLAFARIAMGYPLFVAAALFSLVVVRRARRQVESAAA